jgi:Fe-S-cluster containining protein
MKILNDGIHNCKDCSIFKEYGEVCSSQPELQLDVCALCDTRMCCISPALPLLQCEQNTILDKIDEGEYVEFEGIVPFNIKTKYCKHMDTNTMKCKVYSVCPICCRIAGDSCKGTFWKNTLMQRQQDLWKKAVKDIEQEYREKKLCLK